MGGSGKGGSSEEINTITEPWAGQQGYLSGLYGQANNLPIQHPYPFPGYVPYSPATAGAMTAQTNRAMMGSPVQASGQMENLRTTRGDYLYGGPGFDAAFGAAQRQISPHVRGQFEGVGRYGGGLAQSEETSRLGDAFAGLYGQERGRQQQASLAAPAMAQADYYDIDRLGAVGGAQEARAGQALADAQQRWQAQQQAPYNQLGAQSGVIQGGNWGGQQTQQSPLYSNPMGGALGGAMAGAGLGSMGAPAGATGMAAFGGWPYLAGGAGLGLMASMK